MRKILILTSLLFFIGCTNIPVRKHLMCDRVAAPQIKKLHIDGKTTELNQICDAMLDSATSNLEVLGGPIPNVIVDEDNLIKRYNESKKEAEESGSNYGLILGSILAMLGGYAFRDKILFALKWIGHAATHIDGYTSVKENTDEVVKS